MLKTCVICGKIHDFNKICKRPYKYQKEENQIDLEVHMNGNKREKKLKKR